MCSMYHYSPDQVLDMPLDLIRVLCTDAETLEKHWRWRRMDDNVKAKAARIAQRFGGRY